MDPGNSSVSHSRTLKFFRASGTRVTCRSWGHAPMGSGSPRSRSMARAPSKAFDLDRHCARVNQSAVNFGLKVVDLGTWLGLSREGIARFPVDAEPYICPMYWPQNGVAESALSRGNSYTPQYD